MTKTNVFKKLEGIFIPKKTDTKAIIIKKIAYILGVVVVIFLLQFGIKTVVKSAHNANQEGTKVVAEIPSSDESSEESSKASSAPSSAPSSVPSSEPVSSVASKPATTTSKPKPPTTPAKPNPTVKTPAGYPSGYQPQFKALWDKNKEIKAQLIVPNTKVNYPVPQSSNNNSFYLNHNQYKGSYAWGVPFLDYRVNVKSAKNYIMYGHSDDSKSLQLSGVKNYKNLNFYKSTPVIEFNTVYENAKWKVIGFFIEDVSSKNPRGAFQYQNYINDPSPEKFTNYVDNVLSRSYFTTTVDTTPTDTLMTISTCYSLTSSDFRYVLVARKVRPGESEAVDTAGATANANQLMPARPIR